MKIPIYRPAAIPDVDTAQAGKVWYYLTDAGMKLQPCAYLYRREEPPQGDGHHVYGGECRGYIYADDTARSWENISHRIERELAALGFVPGDRPEHLIVIRTEDGHVRDEPLTDVMVRHAVAVIEGARESVADTFRGESPPCDSERARYVAVTQIADLADALRYRLAERIAWSNVAAQSNRDVDEYLRTIFPSLGEHYGMPVDGIRKVVDAHHAVAERLWQFLDDIDTLDDACRDNDAAFRSAVRKVQKRRFEMGDSDGYRVYWRHRGEHPPERTAEVEAGSRVCDPRGEK